ncbi:hypothetical protein PFLA_b1193 [Pseudoalteromonas flavipulchra NCIMB 2033 = ATCC BAA-314]|nr:hypothetical protein [Pseudoalteromonas flavipulchra NCIMB 2033 = ATCC BAA-314]
MKFPAQLQYGKSLKNKAFTLVAVGAALRGDLDEKLAG